MKAHKDSLSVCGVEGFLEVRSNSRRVCHYAGMLMARVGMSVIF